MRRLALMPPLRGGGVEADEVQGDVFQNGEIMSCIASTGAHLIVGKGHIHTPVQAIFNAPVRPNRPR